MQKTESIFSGTCTDLPNESMTVAFSALFPFSLPLVSRYAAPIAAITTTSAASMAYVFFVSI